MKDFLLVAGILFLGASLAAGNVLKPTIAHQKANLLEIKECTYGPSFWCKNLTNAAVCRATNHCTQTVWSRQQLPRDNTNVCGMCLQMVKEVRWQILSNKTQEEIMEVFKGSCNFIPLKIIANGCCKIADKFAPELIDALASQMDPQMVCSIVGLCNCEHVRELLAQSRHDIASKTSINKPTACEGCYTVVNFVVDKLRSSSHNEVLQTFLQICGKMGNLSDTCSNITLTHYKEMYSYLTENLNPTEFCLMSRKCSEMFHEHVNSRTGVVSIGSGNLPCELCKQFMYQLRDALVVNSTEFEFQQVLLGVCKQMKYFLAVIECTDIVERYYPMIYHFLVHELNSTVLCSLAGLCSGPAIKVNDKAFLVPMQTVESMRHVSQPASINPKSMQFPIELVMLTTLGNPDIGLCVFCQFFTGYVNSVITKPVTEEKVKEIVDGACKVLPIFLNALCERFVGEYGAAFIKAYAGKMDSSIICFHLNVCPSPMHEVQNSPAFMNQNNRSNSTCPLCLFAITSLKDVINNKTAKAFIKRELEYLCSDFKGNSATKCIDFVETYRDEIKELLIKDISSQDVCAALKLCDVDNQVTIVKMQYGDAIGTNQIYNDTAGRKTIYTVGSDNQRMCLVCELLINGFLNALKDNVVEELMHKICNAFSSKDLRDQCNFFIDKYVDRVIHLFFDNLSSLDVCIALNLCKDTENKAFELRDLAIGSNKPDTIAEPGIKSSQCWLCKLIMKQLEKFLNGRISEESIKKGLEYLCSDFKGNSATKCIGFVKTYRSQIIELLLKDISSQDVCAALKLCDAHNQVTTVKMPYGNAIETNQIFDDTAEGKTIFPVESDELELCLVCELVINGFLNEVKSNATEEVMHKICNAFSSKQLRDQCNSFIDKYVDRVIHLFFDNLSALDVCKAFDLCKNSENKASELRDLTIGSNKPDAIAKPSIKSPQCWLCKLIMKQLQKLLNNRISENAIIDALAKVCNFFPSKKEVCDRFVEYYGKKIVEFLKFVTAPEELCSILILCDIGQFKLEISNCTVCEVTVDVMGTILQNPNVNKTLEHVLEKTCQAFPLEIQEICRVIVEINGEEIFLRLSSSLRPGEICKAVKLCGSEINEPGTATVVSQNTAERSYENSNNLLK